MAAHLGVSRGRPSGAPSPAGSAFWLVWAQNAPSTPRSGHTAVLGGPLAAILRHRMRPRPSGFPDTPEATGQHLLTPRAPSGYCLMPQSLKFKWERRDGFPCREASTCKAEALRRRVTPLPVGVQGSAGGLLLERPVFMDSSELMWGQELPLTDLRFLAGRSVSHAGL